MLIASLSSRLHEFLLPVAEMFRRLPMPSLVVQWGHPLMMGIVILVMGSVVGLTGWRGRVLADPQVTQKSLTDHRTIALWMSIFIALGYTGGLLSLVMQGELLLSSPHFWTGSAVLILLLLNGLISLTGFGGNRAALRTTHAYLGSLILCLLFTHALLGLKLGLSLT
jgi:uncharacterized membrane protein